VKFSVFQFTLIAGCHARKTTAIVPPFRRHFGASILQLLHSSKWMILTLLLKALVAFRFRVYGNCWLWRWLIRQSGRWCWPWCWFFRERSWSWLIRKSRRWRWLWRRLFCERSWLRCWFWCGLWCRFWRRLCRRLCRRLGRRLGRRLRGFLLAVFSADFPSFRLSALVGGPKEKVATCYRHIIYSVTVLVSWTGLISASCRGKVHGHNKSIIFTVCVQVD